jgi:hypothetical protein
LESALVTYSPNVHCIIYRRPRPPDFWHDIEEASTGMVVIVVQHDLRHGRHAYSGLRYPLELHRCDEKVKILRLLDTCLLCSGAHRARIKQKALALTVLSSLERGLNDKLDSDEV